MNGLVAIDDIETGETLYLDDLCIRGEEAIAERERRERERIEAYEAEECAKIVEQWQPHYRMLDYLGLGALRQYAPTPERAPEHYSTGYGHELRPLVITLPGYAPVGLYLYENRFCMMGGFCAATLKVNDVFDGWDVTPFWPAVYANEFQAPPTFEHFCMALAQARRVQDGRPALEAEARTRNERAAQAEAESAPEPAPPKHELVRIAEALEEIAFVRGVRKNRGGEA